MLPVEHLQLLRNKLSERSVFDVFKDCIINILIFTLGLSASISIKSPNIEVAGISIISILYIYSTYSNNIYKQGYFYISLFTFLLLGGVITLYLTYAFITFQIVSFLAFLLLRMPKQEQKDLIV